jgi:precorrin-6B methylase 2
MKALTRHVVAAVALLVSTQASAQGWGPTPQEEAKVLSVLGLAPGKTVAEIGAGDGRLSLRAARAVSPGGRAFATELGGSKLETLKRNAATEGVRNIEVIEAQTLTTGLAKGCCDAIFMRDVYHHLTSPDEILADIRKALRPGGRLLIIDFEPRGGLSTVDGVRENRRGHGIPMGVLVNELKAAGFEMISEDAAWREDLYAVVARSPEAPGRE